MTERRPLTLAGSDIELFARLPDGRVRCRFVHHRGARDAHAWELRGLGWHLAAIKQAIAALPLLGSAPVSPAPDPPPRPLLHAHFAAIERED